MPQIERYTHSQEVYYISNNGYMTIIVMCLSLEYVTILMVTYPNNNGFPFSIWQQCDYSGREV